MALKLFFISSWRFIFRKGEFRRLWNNIHVVYVIVTLSHALSYCSYYDFIDFFLVLTLFYFDIRW